MDFPQISKYHNFVQYVESDLQLHVFSGQKGETLFVTPYIKKVHFRLSI